MDIEIRHLEIVKEGVLIYALVPNVERPLLPHYITGDTEEGKKLKRDKWNEQTKIFDAKMKEVALLHLNKAELIQKDE